ncbi:MAG: T9SS type A sorting domain-containing protein [Flavobacterium sp.]
MRKITLLVLFLSTLWGYSQVKDYTFSKTAGTYTEITDGTILGTETNDNQYFVNSTDLLGGTVVTGTGIDIGFDFTFNGYVYNKFAVNTNGWIALGSSDSTPNAVNATVSNAFLPLASTSAVPPAELTAKIAALAKDLIAQGNGASLSYKTTGTSPNRVLVIQWKKYGKKTSTTDDFNFQIRLNEVDNTVEIVYGLFTDTVIPTATVVDTYQVGLRAEPNNVASNFTNIYTTTGWDNSTPGTIATDAIFMNDLYLPSRGLTFKWTPPACNNFKTVSVSNITTTGATLKFDSYLKISNSYEYIVSSSAQLPLSTVSGTSSTSTNLTVSVSNLNPGTTYYVFTRTKCGANFNQWIQNDSFNTQCLETVSFYEDFDNYPSGGSANPILPICWNTINKNTAYLWNQNTVTNKLALSSNANAKSCAIMPPVSNLQTGNKVLKFKAYGASATILNVGYFTNPSDIESFVSIQSFTMPQAGEATALTFVVPITSGLNIPAGIKNLAFKNTGNGLALIDNVIYDVDNNCPDVSAIAVATSNTSVNLSWTKGGTETEWQYVYATPNISNPTTLTPVTVGPLTTTTISGLTPYTTYRVWVRSKCGSNYGAWIAYNAINGTPFFTTNCDDTTQFSEYFDSTPVAISAFPPCWTRVNPNGALNSAIDQLNAPTASNVLLLVNSAANGVPVVALPPLSNATTGTHRLRFMAKFAGVSTTPTLEIGYVTDLTNPLSFEKIADVPNITKTEYNEAILPLGNAPLSKYLAFRVPVLSTNVYIDNVVWEPIPAACAANIKNLRTTAVNHNTISFAWDKGNNENLWEYVLGDSMIQDPISITPVSVTSNLVTISSLSPTSLYKIWVRSKCDSGNGAWIGPLLFTTSCSPISAFSENFDSASALPSCWTKMGKGAMSFELNKPDAPSKLRTLNITGTLPSTSPTTGTAIIAMPPIDNAGAGTHVLRFQFKSPTLLPIEVGYLVDFSNPTSFVTMKSYTAVEPNKYQAEIWEPLADSDITGMLAFRIPGENGTNLKIIDDVIWEAKPLCADVTNLTVNKTTDSSIDLSWTAELSQTMWQYAIGSTSLDNPSALTPIDVTPITSTTAPEGTIVTSINGLTSSTSYKVWVRSKCPSEGIENNFGVWISPVIATTTCPPSSEYTQNFNNINILPSCWNKIGNGGIVKINTNLNQATSLPDVLTLGLIIDNPSQPIVAMPPISIQSIADHQLRFDYKSSVPGCILEIGYLTNFNDANSFVKFEDITINSTGNFQTKVLDLTDYPIESNILAFRQSGFTTTDYFAIQPEIYIDNVSWHQAPTTVPTIVTGITATVDANCGNYATKISWSEVAGADTYKLTIGTTPGGSDVMNNQVVSGLNYSILGKFDTTYYFTLKATNTIGDGQASASQTYQTNPNGCYCISVPKVKNDSGITNVKLDSKNIEIGTGFYFNLTANPIKIARGQHTNMQVTSSTTGIQYNTTVYIDLNDNYEFENSEIQYTSMSNPELNTSFQLPETANLGTHRMRIAFNRYISDDPCFNGSWAQTIDFSVTVIDPIVNDNPSGATPLTVGTTFAANAITGTNVNATASALVTAPECGDYNGADVWYSAIVPSTGNMIFEIKTATGGITNTAAAAYSGTPDSLTSISCNDSGSTAGDNHPKISLTGKTPGETIYFRVWANGGSNSGEFMISAYDSQSLSTDSFDTANFSFYPNPVKDILNVSFDQEINNVSIVNLLGQQVLSKSINANHGTLDLSNLTRGTYLAKITTGDQLKTIKIVKE